MRQYESTRDRALVSGVREGLRELAGEASAFSIDIAEAIREVESLLANGTPAPDAVAASARFGPWFGRGQQYMSFSV